MKAVVIHAPHDLRIDEAAVPAVGPNQVKVRIRAGGICGSDLHYYHHGGFGTVRLRQPMILGHEIAGEVMEIGAGVTRVAPGDRIAVNPSQPCGHCKFCLEGLANHCLDMRFYGSAMRNPHMDGGFREVLVCSEAQAVKLPDGLSMEIAAFAEPLSVCLHAARQAGPLLGKRVLVTGNRYHRCAIADRPPNWRRCGHQQRRRSGCAGEIQNRQGLFRYRVRGLRQRDRAVRCAGNDAATRRDRAVRPRRR
jgi:L-idonate 5-dehydrogenase